MFRVFNSIAFIFLFVSCSSNECRKARVSDAKIQKEFNEYFNSFFRKDFEKTFEYSSKINITETCKFFRLLGETSNNADEFNSHLFGVNSYDELKDLSDEALYKNLIKSNLNGLEKIESKNLHYMGHTIYDNNIRYIVFKYSLPEKIQNFKTEIVKTIRLDNENGEWKFATFDISEPKLTAQLLHFKRKVLQERAKILEDVINDVQKKLNSDDYEEPEFLKFLDQKKEN